MKNLKYSRLLAGAAITLGLAGAGAGIIHAASNTTGNSRVSNLVNAIAQKFNLNPSDVQQVFDQQKSQMQAQRQQDFANRVNQAATNGQLTQDQANKIIAKQQEVQNFMNSLQGKSETDRRAAMQTEMNSLRQWATDNNIPQQYLMMGFGGKGGRGFGNMGNMMGHNAAAGTVASINGNTITLTGNNGTTYTINAAGAIVKKFITSLTSTTTPPAPTTISVSDIKVGDHLKVEGALSGTTVTATQIIDGNFPQGGWHHSMMSPQQ